MSNRGPIWFGIALVIVVGAAGVWIYFIQPSQALNIGIQLATNPANIFVGDQFDLSITLTNNSGSAMQNASVAIVLPSGVVSTDSPSQRVITQPLNTIDPGAVSHKDFHLVATSGANTVFHITAKVIYNADGSSAQFENDGGIDIPLGQPAVTASVSAPASVFSGQNFPIVVNYINNTDHVIPNMSIAMQYPPGFTFSNASSSLTPNGNSSWSMGAIPAQGSGAITINGDIVGPSGGSYSMGATILEVIGNQPYTIVNPTANVALAESPLSLALSANNSQSYVSKTGDSLNYVLTFTNNATIAFQNIVISAKLAGSMFDFSSLTSNGSFNSVADTITWNGAASPQLLSLAPGQSGSVNFYIRTKSAFPIRLLSDKNYSVSVSARLQSPTVPPGTAASSTISIANLTTKLGGSIVLAAKAYHREPTAGVGGSLGASGIANAGPYPPKVNQPTQYTIHWLLTNYATDADNVTLSAYLQSGTTCTGKLLAPASTTLACNPGNGQVTWQIPVVAATTGISGKPLEAVFQVTNTPAVNQIGQMVTLVGPATLSATDGFTSSTMQSSVGPITTALPDDASVSTNNRGVTQ